MRRPLSKHAAATADAALVSHGRGNFSLSGSMSFDNVNKLLADGQKQFDGYKAIKINLANADCSNTAGLALLLEWSTSCRVAGMNIVYEKAQDNLISLARVNDVERLLCFANHNTGNLLRSTGS
jgi:phospholipid transport system transporter-binding protein